MNVPIRLRLAVVTGLLMALALAGLGSFVHLRLRADLMTTVDLGLRSRAEALMASNGSGARSPDLGTVGDGLAESGEAFAQVLDLSGRAVDGSAGLDGGPLLSPAEVGSVSGPTFFDADVRTAEETVPARLLAVPVDDRVLVVGASVEDQQEALSRLRYLLLLGGPVVVLLAGTVGWLVTGLALRPVERMREEAETISGAEGGRRLPVPRTRDELERLADGLNRMLGRLEESLSRERRFVDDASHELRTPLANLKVELELARSRARTPAELQAAIASAADETDRLALLAEDLLVLARAHDGRLPIHHEPVLLAELVSQVVAGVPGRADGTGITVTSEYDGPVAADPARLRQAVGNLLDNALRHASSQVQAQVSADEVWVSLTVADDGPGFPETFLAEAFEPFTRADDARSRDAGGAGLGLAIAAAVVAAHDGTVTAANRPDGGAVVTIRLPRSGGGVRTPVS